MIKYTYTIGPILHDPEAADGWLLTVRNEDGDVRVRRFFEDSEMLLSILEDALKEDEAEDLAEKQERIKKAA